jgi:hypothetical protein
MRGRLTTNFRAPSMCVRWRGNGAHQLAKPAVGRILIESRVPHRVELHVAQLTRRVEDADSTRVSKLGDKSGRNGQYQLGAGQNARPQHVVRHYDGDSARGVARLETPVDPGLADVDAQMWPAQILRQRHGRASRERMVGNTGGQQGFDLSPNLS